MLDVPSFRRSINSNAYSLAHGKSFRSGNEDLTSTFQVNMSQGGSSGDLVEELPYPPLTAAFCSMIASGMDSPMSRCAEDEKAAPTSLN